MYSRYIYTCMCDYSGTSEEMSSMEGTTSDQYRELPGFRFHPTEEELLGFYLRKAANSENLNIGIIPTLDLYRFNPWDLPEKATNIEEREWYFFVPRHRRQSNGGRPNRTTEKGFWKATGSDRRIRSVNEPKRVIGLKKTLVFYQGRAPHVTKTDWIMNEYRLPDDAAMSAAEDIVLCKVYRKATTMKELEQRAAVAEQEKHPMAPAPAVVGLERDRQVKQTELEPSSYSSVGEARPLRRGVVPELELPVPKTSLDWTMQDSFLMQMRSPLMEHWSPYANLLNF